MKNRNIDNVVLVNEHGDTLMPYEQLGIYMKSHTVSPPKPKLHRFALDGADGELDLSEWAGEVKFESRTVEIEFRDVEETYYQQMVQFALGRMLDVMFSDDPECYLHGRCDSVTTQTKKRVSDVTMTLICDPYRLMRTRTRYQVVSNGSASVMLRARRMPATPTINATDECTVTFDGETHTIYAGTHTYFGIKITDQPKLMEVTGSSTLVISWTDGVL